MTLTARWVAVGDTLAQAQCGRPGCCPDLAETGLRAANPAAEDSRTWFERTHALIPNMVLTPAGFWRLDSRTERQWQSFKAAGKGWREFHPEHRHWRAWRDNGLVWLPLPLVMKCPVCGFINEIPTVPETIGLTARRPQ